MKKYIKSLVASLLLIVFVITTYLPATALGDTLTYSKEYNSGERDVVCTTLDGTSADDYYEGNYEYDVLSTKSSTEIFNSLKTLMRSTHTYKSTYNDCHYKADRTDCENGDGKVSLIYTSYSATMEQWNGWNREHVWPKSLGGNNDDDRGGGADMHHIRPSDAVVNSTRGNKLYGYTNGGKSVYGSNPASGVLGGYVGSGYYEPLDNVKGDVARICLYVYVRWNSDWGADSITKVFQSVDVLLEWCELDPVDTWEIGRNEVIGAIQGNRNVFIDYPEYAWLIFGKTVPADMTTPSGEAKENSGNQGGSGDSGDQGGGNTGTETPACTHDITELKNYQAADCFNDGYTGDRYCVSCGKKTSTGSIISAKKGHSFASWTISADGSNYERRCSACGEVQIMTVDNVIAAIEDDSKKILIILALGAGDLSLIEELTKQQED